MVDEFQDTNGVQSELVTILGDYHHNVFVVGDADQSIYRFRAADVRNILQFEERFPDADVVLLEQNFRSTQTILDAANAVIAKVNGAEIRQSDLTIAEEELGPSLQQMDPATRRDNLIARMWYGKR